MKTVLKTSRFTGGWMGLCAGGTLLLASTGAAQVARPCDWFDLNSFGACVPGTACLPAGNVSGSCTPVPSGMVMAAHIGPVGSDVVQATVGGFFEVEFEGDLPCGMPAGTSLNVHYTVNAAHGGGVLVVNGAMFMAKVDDGAGNFTYLNGHMFPNVEVPSGTSYAGQFSTFQLPTGGPTGTWMMFVGIAYTPPPGAPTTLDFTIDPILVTVVPPPACPADINRDGVINTVDLTLLLLRFGQSAPPGSEAAPADLNGDGFINTSDLTQLLYRFGQSCV